MSTIKWVFLLAVLCLPISAFAGSSQVAPEAGGWPWSYKFANVDALVKTGPGVLHTVTCEGIDAAATAGTIILYDNTAESGAVMFFLNVAAAALNPFTVTIDVPFATGLYVGYTTTNDVYCHISWK